MQGQTNRTMMERHIPQTLRNTMTDSESRLWQRLRGRQLAGCKFRRQHPFFDYVLDFVCLERYLIVEVDGGQHLESGRDKIRDKRLQEAGFQILRFWNNEVLEDIDAVVEAIWMALNLVPASVLPLNPIPTPTLPLKGRENSLGLAGEGEQLRLCSGLAGEGEQLRLCSGLAGEGEQPREGDCRSCDHCVTH
jgi:very-short-patch-repair endonuclease